MLKFCSMCNKEVSELLCEQSDHPVCYDCASAKDETLCDMVNEMGDNVKCIKEIVRDMKERLGMK